MAHKITDRQHDHCQKWQRPLGARKHAGHLRHHIAHQKNDDDHGHQRHDGRVERSANQLGLQRLAGFKVIGQILQHRAQTAAGFACANDGTKNIRKLARVLLQRTRKAGARIDLGPQSGQQLVLAGIVRFFGQRRQGALNWQARADQTRELARPHRQRRGVEDRAGKQTRRCRAASALTGGYRLNLQRHQRLAAQLATCRAGVVGFQRALAGLTLGVQGFKGKGGHARIRCFLTG